MRAVLNYLIHRLHRLMLLKVLCKTVLHPDMLSCFFKFFLTHFALKFCHVASWGVLSENAIVSDHRGTLLLVHRMLEVLHSHKTFRLLICFRPIEITLILFRLSSFYPVFIVP